MIKLSLTIDDAHDFIRSSTNYRESTIKHMSEADMIYEIATNLLNSQRLERDDMFVIIEIIKS